MFIPALASCVFLELAACSSASSTSSAASSPSACSSVLSAIGPYATEKFSPAKVGQWANQVVSATGTQVVSLSRKVQTSSNGSGSVEKKLLSDENKLYNDAVLLENYANGSIHLNTKDIKAKMPGALSSVTGDLKRVYADCGQTIP